MSLRLTRSTTKALNFPILPANMTQFLISPRRQADICDLQHLVWIAGAVAVSQSGLPLPGLTVVDTSSFQKAWRRAISWGAAALRLVAAIFAQTTTAWRKLREKEIVPSPYRWKQKAHVLLQSRAFFDLGKSVLVEQQGAGYQ